MSSQKKQCCVHNSLSTSVTDSASVAMESSDSIVLSKGSEPMQIEEEIIQEQESVSYSVAPTVATEVPIESHGVTAAFVQHFTETDLAKDPGLAHTATAEAIVTLQAKIRAAEARGETIGSVLRASKSARAYIDIGEIPVLQTKLFRDQLLHRTTCMMRAKAMLYAQYGVSEKEFHETIFLRTVGGEAVEMNAKKPSPKTASIVEKMTDEFTEAARSGRFKLAPWYDMACVLLLADLLMGEENVRQILITDGYGTDGVKSFFRILQNLTQPNESCLSPISVAVISDAGEEADDQMMITLLCHLSFTFPHLEINIFVGSSVARISAQEQFDVATLCLQDVFKRDAPCDRVHILKVEDLADHTIKPSDYLLICAPVDSQDPVQQLQNMGCGAWTTVIMQGSDDRFNKIQSTMSFQKLCDEKFAHLGIKSFIGMTSDESKLVASPEMIMWFVNQEYMYSLQSSVSWSLRSAICFCDPKKGLFWSTLIQHNTDPQQGGSNWNVLSGIVEIALAVDMYSII